MTQHPNGWWHGDVDLDALARRVAARLPHDDRSLRAAGLGREDLVPEARLVVADLVRRYDPARGDLESWVFGATRRAGADLARRGVGRPASRPRPTDAATTPEDAFLARLRAALGDVTTLDPADADKLAEPATDPDRLLARRRLWGYVEAASQLDAEHARERADADDDSQDPLTAVLPGTLGALVLAAQTDGASLLEVSRQVGLPVAFLARAARAVADRARALDARQAPGRAAA